MKKNCFVILFLITFCMHLVAEPDYKDGNGTIISSITEKEIRKTVRKCEVDNIRIGDLLDEKNRDIYTDYNFDNKIGMLKDNDMIKVLEVCEIEIFGGYASIERGGPKYYIPENIVISDLSGYGY